MQSKALCCTCQSICRRQVFIFPLCCLPCHNTPPFVYYFLEVWFAQFGLHFYCTWAGLEKCLLKLLFYLMFTQLVLIITFNIHITYQIFQAPSVLTAGSKFAVLKQRSPGCLQGLDNVCIIFSLGQTTGMGYL